MRGFAVGHLQNVLRVNDALDVVNAFCVHRNARVVLGAQHFDETLHRGFHRHGKHLRTRLHGFAHRLAAEFDDRLNQIAVAFLNNSFFLSGFDQSIHRLRRAFWLLARVLAGERSNGLQESQNDRHRQNQINQACAEAMSTASAIRRWCARKKRKAETD